MAFAEYSKVKSDVPQTIVNQAIVNSPEYRNKFSVFSEKAQVERTMFTESRKMLLHRTGTEYEDLTFIDSNTGKHLTRNDYNVIREVVPSKRMIKMAQTAEQNTIIAIHNHPLNGLPSIVDIKTAAEKKYKYGLIVCHNSNIFRYKILDDFDLSKDNLEYVDMLLDKTEKIVYNKKNLGNKYMPKLLNALKDLNDKKVSLEVFLWE